MRDPFFVKFSPSVDPGLAVPLDSGRGLRYNKIKLGAALFIVGRADRALFLFFQRSSNKKPGSPSLISDLGRTYTPFGHACTYTLQNFRVFVPPNFLQIEGKTKILPKARKEADLAAKEDLKMKKLCVWMLILLLTAGLSGCKSKSTLSPAAPVTLTMWHVYGEQADSPMNRLVDLFNETLGKEKGIIIDVTVVTNSSKLGPQLLDAHANKPGAPTMPDLFSAFPSIVEAIGVEHVLDWHDYFSDEELSHFVEEFIADGMLENHLAVFPVSKSSYALFINGSQFDRFSADTGVSFSDLTDWNGFFDAAAQYHEWSGGKSFCAFDYLLHNMELDALARGATPYTSNGWYNFEDLVLQESWMQFARSLVQGHISLSAPYSSTQLTTGEALAGIGSTAGILYFNDTVTYPDNTSERTNLRVLPLPRTEGTAGMMPVTGVGLSAYRTTEQKAEAASVFLHWFTENQRNLDFVVETGYMPVNNGAFDAIDGYSFPSESYRELYAAIKTMRDTYTPFIQTAGSDFYSKANTLYEELRQMQPSWHQRAQQGEPIDALAEETWNLFRSVQ